MKFLILMVMFLFTACSSSQVNTAKLNGAKRLGDGLATFLKVEYKHFQASMECAAEADATGEKLEAWVADKLGASQPAPFASLSAGGQLAKMACGMVAEFIEKEFADNKCFAQRFGEYSQDYIGDKLCNSIQF